MFSRKEYLSAIRSTGLEDDEVFNRFVNTITAINPSMMCSEEGMDIIMDAIYSDTTFNKVLSSIIVLYNELRQSRGPTSVIINYAHIYASPLLEKIAGISFLVDWASESFDDSNILLELIVLINIYNQKGAK